MARFRTVEPPTITTNYEGGRAYKQSAKEELIFAVLTTLAEDTFYESKDSRLTRISALVEDIAKKDPTFIAKLALVARREFHMRSAFHILVGELSNFHKGDSLVRKTIYLAAERPDDLMEILAYKTSFKSNQVKKGVADAVGKFNEYALAKHRGEGSSMNIYDVFNLSHPVAPTVEQDALYRRVIKGGLAVPETWETKISGKGATKENWEAIVPKMGYMALLRNLRNLLDKEVSQETIDFVCKKLEDPEEVRKSKQFPYRFYSAYAMLQGNDSPNATQVLDAVQLALEASVQNIPRFKGTTFIVADNSGSMESTMSEKSVVKRRDVANLLMAMAHRFCDKPICGIFGEEFKVKTFSRVNGIISNMATVINGEVGHSTDAWLAVDYLIENRVHVDRILLFSDMQCYDTYSIDSSEHSLAYQFAHYRHVMNPETYLYSFDLAGHGTAQFADDKKVLQLAGWSDKIFGLMPMIERGESLTDYVANYPLEESHIKPEEQ